MKIFPSVDILDGNAVRLLQGDRTQITRYGDPLEVVAGYVAAGAEIVHVVDLNGAFDGVTVNDDILKQIGKLKIKKQLGGGLRTTARVAYVLQTLGFDRAVLGSACVNNIDMVSELCSMFGNRIVGCLDTKDGKVAINGWQQSSQITPLALAKQLKQLGICDLVFTDISRDGAMGGVNFELTGQLQNACGMNVIASGGVKDLEDLRQLMARGVYGAILGKALYTGAIPLKEALTLCTQNALFHA